MNSSRCLFAAAAACVVIVGARADVVVLTSNHDNTMYEDVTGSLSTGAGSGMFAGTTGQNLLRRALLSFDVSAIPAGSIVTDVRVTLHLSRASTGATDVAFHRTLASWGEGTSVASGEQGQGAAATPGDATWVHRFFPTDTWAAAGGGAGGYFVPGASAVTSVGGGPAFF